MLTAITLDPLPEQVTRARYRVAHAITRIDVDPELCERVILALSELATNAVLHGSNNPIRIEVHHAGDEIELVVSQDADGAAVPDLGAWRLPDEKGQIGGRGLAIVAMITDGVEVNIDGRTTEVRARFIPRPAGSQPVP